MPVSQGKAVAEKVWNSTHPGVALKPSKVTVASRSTTTANTSLVTPWLAGQADGPRAKVYFPALGLLETLVAVNALTIPSRQPASHSPHRTGSFTRTSVGENLASKPNATVKTSALAQPLVLAEHRHAAQRKDGIQRHNYGDAIGYGRLGEGILQPSEGQEESECRPDAPNLTGKPFSGTDFRRLAFLCRYSTHPNSIFQG